MSYYQSIGFKRNDLPQEIQMDGRRKEIVKDLDEKRIKEIAAFQFPSEGMYAYTIRKDFREAHDPQEEFHYDNLSALKE